MLFLVLIHPTPTTMAICTNTHLEILLYFNTETRPRAYRIALILMMFAYILTEWLHADPIEWNKFKVTA